MCTRPHSYPASIAPVLFGATYALGYESKFSILKFILFLLACLLIQAATNLFNEYYDYKHGLDKVDSEGISGSIVKGNLSPKRGYGRSLGIVRTSLWTWINFNIHD